MNAPPVIMTALITVPTRQDPMSVHVRQAILWQMTALPVMVSIKQLLSLTVALVAIQVPRFFPGKKNLRT